MFIVDWKAANATAIWPLHATFCAPNGVNIKKRSHVY